MAAQYQGSLTVPALVGTDATRALMKPLAGVDLRERGHADWAAALAAVLSFAQRAGIAEWLGAGTRDFRGGWQERLASLFDDHGFPVGSSDRFASRFDGLPAVVLPHDLGPCNLRWLGEGRVQGFDWSDVVIGMPGMALHRFLNEARHLASSRSNGDQESLLAAFGDPRGWASTARCAPLHEVCRYQAELSWLDDDDPLAIRLREGIARQLGRVLADEHT